MDSCSCPAYRCFQCKFGYEIRFGMSCERKEPTSTSSLILKGLKILVIDVILKETGQGEDERMSVTGSSYFKSD